MDFSSSVQSQKKNQQYRTIQNMMNTYSNCYYVLFLFINFFIKFINTKKDKNYIIKVMNGRIGQNFRILEILIITKNHSSRFTTGINSPFYLVQFNKLNIWKITIMISNIMKISSTICSPPS